MRSLSLVLSSSMARLARRRSAQRTLGMRMRSSAARIARIAIRTTTQSGKLTCDPMQNPDPATPRVTAPRRHDTVWNSIVTSAPSLETGQFPAIARSVRNRDIDDVRSNQTVDSFSDARLHERLQQSGVRYGQLKDELGCIGHVCAFFVIVRIRDAEERSWFQSKWSACSSLRRRPRLRVAPEVRCRCPLSERRGPRKLQTMPVCPFQTEAIPAPQLLRLDPRSSCRTVQPAPVGGFSISSQAGDVSCWRHKADMAAGAADVRFQEQGGLGAAAIARLARSEEHTSE